MKFRVLAADCPWAFGDALRMSKVKRGAASNYGVLTPLELAALPIGDLMEDDAFGLLWFPDALAWEAGQVFRAWGFRQTQVWTWVKTGKFETRLDGDDVQEDLALAFGMGRLARNCCEHALVGVRGSIYKHVSARDVRNVFLHPGLPHSQKPEVVQDGIDRMVPTGNRLELFARRARLNWSCIGDQAPDTLGQDILESLAGLLRAT